jgi:hypothetical protein
MKQNQVKDQPESKQQAPSDQVSAPNPKDGRSNSQDLIDKLHHVFTQHSWRSHEIYRQSGYPIFAYSSPAVNHVAMWVLAGIHGEEPAPSESILQEREFLAHLGETLPLVVLPLLNPLGRSYDWRYENEPRDWTKGLSVSSAYHLLLDQSNQPRSPKAVSPTNDAITNWVCQYVQTYPPLLVIDHHEDRVDQAYPPGDPRKLDSSYVYYAGSSAGKRIAVLVKKTLAQASMPISQSGKTRFGEPIQDGLVKNQSDGSIDEFFAAKKFFDPGKRRVVSKNPAKAVIVVETTIPIDQSIKLETRIAAHRAIIQNYPLFWKLVN